MGEEREAKYVRMLTSSLLGVKRLLSLLLPDDRTALEQRLANLISPAKFWKYSKHKTPQVLDCFIFKRCLESCYEVNHREVFSFFFFSIFYL